MTTTTTGFPEPAEDFTTSEGLRALLIRLYEGGEDAWVHDPVARDLMEFVVALVCSKLVLVVIFLVAVTQVSAPIDADLASISDPIAGIVLMAMAAFAPYLTYKFIAFAGFDMYHAISSEQDAKSALNRPIPVPSKPQGGADPKKVLDGSSGGGNAGGSTGGGSSAPPPPKTPAPTHAASSGGAAGGGGAAAAGPVAVGVVIGARVAKGAATAGPKAGTALGTQGEHTADAAAQTPPPPATPAAAPPSSPAPRPPSADPSPPPPKQPPPPAPRPTKE